MRICARGEPRVLTNVSVRQLQVVELDVVDVHDDGPLCDEGPLPAVGPLLDGPLPDDPLPDDPLPDDPLLDDPLLDDPLLDDPLLDGPLLPDAACAILIVVSAGAEYATIAAVPNIPSRASARRRETTALVSSDISNPLCCFREPIGADGGPRDAHCRTYTLRAIS